MVVLVALITLIALVILVALISLVVLIVVLVPLVPLIPLVALAALITPRAHASVAAIALLRPSSDILDGRGQKEREKGASREPHGCCRVFFVVETLVVGLHQY